MEEWLGGRAVIARVICERRCWGSVEGNESARRAVARGVEGVEVNLRVAVGVFEAERRRRGGEGGCGSEES